jgi:hypothetical protein
MAQLTREKGTEGTKLDARRIILLAVPGSMQCVLPAAGRQWQAVPGERKRDRTTFSRSKKRVKASWWDTASFGAAVEMEGRGSAHDRKANTAMNLKNLSTSTTVSVSGEEGVAPNE